MSPINNLFKEWNERQKHNQHASKLNEFNEIIESEAFRDELKAMYDLLQKLDSETEN